MGPVSSGSTPVSSFVFFCFFVPLLGIVTRLCSFVRLIIFVFYDAPAQPRWRWRGISTARPAHGSPRLRCGADNTKAGVSPRVLFRSIGEKMPQRPPMWSCEIRRARPGARAPVVPNQPKPRFYVKIVRSPLLLTKLIYGASPIVVPVGVMQKTGLKSTHNPPN